MRIFFARAKDSASLPCSVIEAKMATIKVACPKCGQKVSGDETFSGSKVECPICSADIHFPGVHRKEAPVSNAEQGALPDRSPDSIRPVPPEPPTQKAESGIASEPEKLSRETAISLENPDSGQGGGPCSPVYGAISIVSAVLSVVTCVGAPLFAPLAIIFGHTALAKARHSSVQPAPGHTLGAIGLMIGYVCLVITIILLLALILFGDSIREAIGQADA